MVSERERMRGEYAQWKVQSVSLRDRLKLPAKHAPWTGRANVKLRGVRASERQRDLLDVCFEVLRRRNGNGNKPLSEVIANSWCNVSQSVERMPVYSGSIPTLTRNTELYSFEHDTVLSGESHLRLLGWPQHFCSGDFSQGELRNLAGDSVSVPVFALLLAAMYNNPHAPWWARQ